MIERHFCDADVFLSYFSNAKQYDCPLFKRELSVFGRKYLANCLEQGMAELVQLNKANGVDDVGSHNWLMRVLLEQQFGSNYPAVIQQSLVEIEQLKSRVVQEPLMELKANLAAISVERLCL